MNQLAWVNCDYEMPEQGVEVLVCDEGGKQFITVHHRGYFRDFRVGHSRKEITHWQKLPDPPIR